jgi:hypothetical protein
MDIGVCMSDSWWTSIDRQRFHQGAAQQLPRMQAGLQRKPHVRHFLELLEDQHNNETYYGRFAGAGCDDEVGPPGD